MSADRDGFLVPEVDASKCVNCGKCLKVCPVHEPSYHHTQSPDCYAVMADDAIRKKSSSGGVFTLLANWMLEQGGVVCGAAYTGDCYGVEHILVEKKDDLDRLRGSKYVQSITGQIYREVKARLDQGTPVLFTGTPCQVAGLHNYLKQKKTNTENLYLVDLICHGVPSPLVWEQYLQSISSE
jgi:coenzyme F420-reducing hydrogenase beta subunit